MSEGARPGMLELPWGDNVICLRRHNLDPNVPLDQYNEVFPEYVNAVLKSPRGNRDLGDAPWRRLRDRLLRWLRNEPVHVAGPESEWTGLTHFEPLQYSLYGSVDRPPWKLMVMDGRASPPNNVVEHDVTVSERQSWIELLS